MCKSTLHGVTRRQVRGLWRTVRTMEAKFVPPGVWKTPPMPDWIRLLWATARK